MFAELLYSLLVILGAIAMGAIGEWLVLSILHKNDPR